MANLDSLGWAAGCAVVSYGVRIGLRVTDPGSMPELRSALPVGAKPLASTLVDHLYSVVVAGGSGAGRRRKLSLLFAGTHLLARQRSLEALVDDLENDVLSLIGTRAPRHVFIHAGVVGWRGRAIVMPGRSFTGKSTLVAALVGHGASYLSDEFAILDSSGRVHPYPRPLGLREPGEQKGQPTPVETLGGCCRRSPMLLGWVIAVPYAADSSWAVEPMGTGETALELVSNSLAIREAPERVLATIARVCDNAAGFRGRRGDADNAARAILGLVSAG